MAAVIEITNYTATDWHDWQETMDYLFDVDPVQFMDKVKEHFLSIFPKEDCTAEWKNNESGVPSMLVVKDTESDGTYTYDVTVKENVISFELADLDGSCQITDTVTYTLHDEEDIVYLPAQEFIAFPKVSPGEDRIYHGYFTDRAKAEEVLQTMQEKEKYGFCVSRKHIIARSKKSLENSTFYRMNMALVNYDKYWHPMALLQLYQVGEAIVRDLVAKQILTEEQTLLDGQKNWFGFQNRNWEVIKPLTAGTDQEIVNLLIEHAKVLNKAA